MFPRAENAGAYWANIKGRIDAIIEVPPTHWRREEYFDADPKAPDRVYSCRGGFLSPVEFNPIELGISPHTLEATDSTQLLGLLVAREALRDAGYLGGRVFDKSRVSVILGVTGTLELVIPLGARLGHPIWKRALKEAGVPDEVAADVVERISSSYVPWQENSFPGLLGNVAAGRIASRLDLGGTNCVVDAACASSLSAVHLAALELSAGRCDMAVSGGLDTFNDIFMYMCFTKTPALSPSGHARPFDAASDGTTLGEGLGVVVLKRLEDARRDGDRVYAVIRGIGTSSDGKGSAIYAPSASGQAKALRAAYEVSGVSPATIELLEAHGTGTRVGDITEATALTEVYTAARPHGAWCAIGSVKSQIGHTKAAAGAAGLIKAVLALHAKVLPPTAKVTQPVEPLLPGKSPFYVNMECRPWLARSSHPRRAAVSAFGFGGSNFHCVIEEAIPEKSAPDWDGDVQIIPFSASSAAELATHVASWPLRRAAESAHALRLAAAASRRTLDGTLRYRLVVAARHGASDLGKMWESLGALLRSRGSEQAWMTPDGAFYCSAPASARGKLALIFPGQGSQHVGMLRDLVCLFPEALNAIAEGDAAYSGGTELEHGERLSDRIYPPHAFTTEERTAQEAALRETACAQPAIGAASLAALRVLARFGVKPEMTAGHSFGELTALAAAGWIDPHALLRLASLRGRIMTADTGDRGAMAAVALPLKELESLLATEAPGLVLANRNTPVQGVVSGPTAQVESLLAKLETRGVRAKRLPVSGAFHSSLVAAATRPLADALRSVVFTPTTIPVFSNTLARAYPEDPEAARSVVSSHLSSPVDFDGEVRAMHRLGARVFLEAGPSNKLTGLVGAILAKDEHTALCLDASCGKGSGTLELARTLCQLWALGFPVDLAKWDEAFDPNQAPPAAKPGASVTLTGANYVKPRERKPPVTCPSVTVPVSVPATVPVSDSAAPPALVPVPTQESLDSTLAALLQMQEKTAELHRQFLEGQETANRTLQRILESQAGAPGFRPIEVATHTGEPAAARMDPAPRPEPQPTVSQGPEIPVPISGSPETPAPRSAPPAPPAPALKAPSGSEIIAPVLLAVVAEKTGYPAEMLNLDMSLEADLGIDSIKRVEIFSALRERLPNAPEVTPAELPSLVTLRSITEFLAGSAGLEAAPLVTATMPSMEAATHSAAASAPEAESALISTVAEKTGYPAEMLNLDMSLEVDLGIDSIKRVEIFSALRERLPDAPEITPDKLPLLGTLRAVAQFLSHAAPATSSALEKTPTFTVAPSTPELAKAAPESPPAPRLDRFVIEAKPIDRKGGAKLPLKPGGEVWIASRDPVALQIAALLRARGFAAIAQSPLELLARPQSMSLHWLILFAPPPEAQIEAAAFELLQLLQRSSAALRTGSHSAHPMVTGIIRLDGRFNLESPASAESSVAAGALAGIVKTVAREWPEVHARVIDLAGELTDSLEAAEALLEELELDGPLELGLSRGGATTIETVRSALPEESSHRQLCGPGDTIVVTGGARGVTAEVAVALADYWRVNLLLLGRTRPPSPGPASIEHLGTEAELKREILLRLGESASPRAVTEEYNRLVADREIRSTLSRIERNGARVLYRQADVRDRAQVERALKEARTALGPIRGVVLGAGVLADKRIEDKTVEQVRAVLSTKVEGARCLITATEGDDLKLIVFFSSSTGRFGRSGQVDYAAANDALNKLARHEARRKPGCRVLSMNWGPWEGGMVTPVLRKVFETEGVGLIPLADGSRQLILELEARESRDVEVVILADGSRSPASSAGSPGDLPTPLKLPASSPTSPSQTAFKLDLSVDKFPLLASHVLNGKAVLPAALMLEWLAHGAIHGHPGLIFQGFEEFKVFKGVILGPEDTLPLRITTHESIPGADAHSLRVPVELWSGDAGTDRVHARATVLLGDELISAPRFIAEPRVHPYPQRGPLYDGQRLFHGRDFHAIDRVEGVSEEGITALVRTSPPPATWIQRPLRGSWITDPLAIDAAFQLLILWSFERHGKGCLPSAVGSYRQFRRAFPHNGLRLLARVTRSTPSSVEAEVDLVALDGKPVARMERCECVLDESLEAAFGRNQISGRTADGSNRS